MLVTDMLRSLEVKAKLFSSLAQVDLIQTFHNHTKESVELSYLFPVPPKAQVTKFIAQIGDKTIQSEIEETEKAYEEYDKAIEKGDTAGIVESIRKDVMELSFGNLLPSETAVITLSYLQELSYTDGSTDLTWRIPFVVAPRYDGNPTPESERIQPIIGKNATTIQVEAIIQTLKPIRSIASPSHPIEVVSEKEQTTVRLSKNNMKPDSDFVLHIKYDTTPMNHLFTEKDQEKGYFSLLQITPEIPAGSSKEEARQVGFLLDISGSMDGEKIHQAKQALKLCLRQLNSLDAFNILAFSSQYYCFRKTFIAYHDESMKKADEWIDEVHESGGTEIFAPLSALLSMMNPEKPGIILLFTDGQVSDEEKIIRLVEEHAHHIQLFSFGIDTAINESFIDGIAKAGNGLPEYIVPGERIEDKVLRQLDRMSAPYWNLPECFDETGEPLEVYPPFPKKMFANETYHHLFHPTTKEKLSKISFHATLKEKKIAITFKSEKSQTLGSLQSWWALEKIRAMEKNLVDSNPRRKTTQQKAIVEISKQYGVLSTFTALVAVMTRELKAKGMPRWVRIPVCAPKGWEMLHFPNRGAMPDAMPPSMPGLHHIAQVSDSRRHFAKKGNQFLFS